MTTSTTIAVGGATATQGRGVMASLNSRGGFLVGTLRRAPGAHGGPADKVLAADFAKPKTLVAAPAGVCDAFADTNRFAGSEIDESIAIWSAANMPVRN